MTRLSFTAPTSVVADADYELEPGHAAPKGGLQHVRVSRLTGSRVYFCDAASARGTDTMHYSIPAGRFERLFRPVTI